MHHSSTCQCGGSGFEKSSTDNPLKIPIPCTPPQQIVELEKAFRNRFGNYGLYENQGYAGYKDVLSEVESFIISHSQALQERHEAEIKSLSSKHKEDVRALRKAVEKKNPCRSGCHCGVRSEECNYEHQFGMAIDAFDSTLKERGISL